MQRTFEQWLADVDGYLAERMIGLTTSDLPDCPYRDWYEEGITYVQAAKRAIRDAT